MTLIKQTHEEVSRKLMKCYLSVSIKLLRFQFQDAKNTLKNYQGRYQFGGARTGAPSFARSATRLFGISLHSLDM
jgi:hypothetical protein